MLHVARAIHLDVHKCLCPFVSHHKVHRAGSGSVCVSRLKNIDLPFFFLTLFRDSRGPGISICCCVVVGRSLFLSLSLPFLWTTTSIHLLSANARVIDCPSTRASILPPTQPTKHTQHHHHHYYYCLPLLTSTTSTITTITTPQFWIGPSGSVTKLG
ncbi:hypothetical protein GQ44DRAFT_703491 [Phaeosphaeriaceae sp. PMI808]|nr:hypothetical protein GQ44DRAFT_703491 [Phaeosphaeriaceae sp. PMI808]